MKEEGRNPESEGYNMGINQPLLALKTEGDHESKNVGRL